MSDFARQLGDLVTNARRKGFFHLFSVNVLVNILTFGSQLLVAWILNPIDIGRIKTIQSVLGIAVIIGGLGLNTAVLKLCSENRDYSIRWTIFERSFYYSLVGAIFTVAVIECFAFVGWGSPDTTTNRWLMVSALSLPAMVLTNLMMAYLQATKNIHRMSFVQLTIRTGGLIGIVMLTYGAGMGGYVWGSVVMSILGTAMLFKVVSSMRQRVDQKTRVLNVSIHFALWSFLANITYTATQYMDVILLNYSLESRAELGYYSLATIFVLGLTYFNATVQTIATPYFSEKSDNPAEFRRVLYKYQMIMTLLSVVIALLAGVLVPPLVIWAFGSAYESSIVYFRVLLVKYVAWSCYVLLGGAMIGLGKMKHNFVVDLITLIFSVFITSLFIRHYQLLGAAFAQVIVNVFALVAMVVVTHRALKSMESQNPIRKS